MSEENFCDIKYNHLFILSTIDSKVRAWTFFYIKIRTLYSATIDRSGMFSNIKKIIVKHHFFLSSSEISFITIIGIICIMIIIDVCVLKFLKVNDMTCSENIIWWIAGSKLYRKLRIKNCISRCFILFQVVWYKNYENKAFSTRMQNK